MHLDQPIGEHKVERAEIQMYTGFVLDECVQYDQLNGVFACYHGAELSDTQIDCQRGGA